MNKKIELLPVLLNGHQFVVVNDLAINTAGYAVRVEDPAPRGRRF